jgi:hypothetical protein
LGAVGTILRLFLPSSLRVKVPLLARYDLRLAAALRLANLQSLGYANHFYLSSYRLERHMEHSFSGPLFRRILGLAVALSPLLVLLLALSPAAPVQASGTQITNCSNDNDLQTAVLGGGLITFNCGNTHAAAAIPLSGELAPISGTTIDGSNGGHTIVLDGQGGTRVFQVGADTQVTLTNLVMTGGTAIDGSCGMVQGSLELDNIEIHHCVAGSGNFGGALYVDSGASATLNNANLHDNSAGISGGGIYSLGKLTVNNSSFAHNAAGTDGGPVGDGGGIWGAGFTEVNGGTFFSNTAAIGYGGGIYNQGILIAAGVSLQANTAGQWGGGIRNWTGSATLIQVTLSENQAVNGGGIASDGTGSNLGLEDDTTLLSNQAQADGGGIYIADGSPISSPDLSDAVYRNNSALHGGGLYVSGPVFVGYSTFAGNSAPYGGAIDNHGDVDIRYVTLFRNSGFYGGGINNTGTALLFNDTLSSNSSSFVGGGFHDDTGARATLWNVTLAGNSAMTSGGAAYVESGGVLTVTNTILAYSPSGGNCGGALLVSSQSSISDDVTCSLSGAVHGHPANGLDPHLSALGNYGGLTLVHMPEHNSPAIDGVSGANAPTDDQRLKPRPANGGQGNGYDIGAVERQPTDTDKSPWLWLPLVRR